MTPKSTSGEDTGAWSNASASSAASGETKGPDSEVCPLCDGAGFLRRDVPLEHPDFGRLVSCQCREREAETGRLAILQRYSNLGPLTRLSFENLLPQGRSSDPANQERFKTALAACRAYAEDPRGWLVLSGITGCGKTHLAAAIANRRLGRGHPAFFIVVPDLLDHLRAAFGPQSNLTYDELFELVRNAPLLILDDLGAHSSTPWAEEKLYQLMNHRFNAQLPTVVTTNVPLEDTEERLRTRLTDPDLCHIIEVGVAHLPLWQQVGGMDMKLLSQMVFDNFEWRRDNISREQQESLRRALTLARNFAEAGEGWVIFQGVNGCGKTHLAAAIANHHLRAGQPVFFVAVPEFLDHLRATFTPDSKITYDALFEKVKTAPLLILDDFGEQASTPWAQEKLYQIINYRYNARLPMVVTTCVALEDIEPRISSRMVDPKVSTVFGIVAPDYRGDRPLPRANVEAKSRPPQRRRRS